MNSRRRGFIRRLDKACKKEVKRSSPKTFQEAIKFSLINEDSTRPGALTSPTNTEPKSKEYEAFKFIGKSNRKLPFFKGKKQPFEKKQNIGPKLSQDDFDIKEKINI